MACHDQCRGPCTGIALRGGERPQALRGKAVTCKQGQCGRRAPIVRGRGCQRNTDLPVEADRLEYDGQRPSLHPCQAVFDRRPGCAGRRRRKALQKLQQDGQDEEDAAHPHGIRIPERVGVDLLAVYAAWPRADAGPRTFCMALLKGVSDLCTTPASRRLSAGTASISNELSVPIRENLAVTPRGQVRVILLVASAAGVGGSRREVGALRVVKPGIALR